jgi:signal peptidase II
MLVSIDQLTKFLVTTSLRPNDSIPIFEAFLRITYVQNSGMAFGLFANVDPNTRVLILLLFPSLILAGMLFLFAKIKESQIISIYAYCFIVGGALGNILDRVRAGHVVDFLDFHFHHRWHFPAFNIADCAVSFGIFLLCLHLIFEREARGE